ncbi:flagellin [Roseovarius salinarum]|uniref:flagellin n=1 Tax=Roseovarius salinarum TaxID=1981892 RepID=UPI000C321FF3|nr:flagellin [Roseovarius salinarum]
MVSLGDLAQVFALRRQNAQLSDQLAVLSKEMASGRVSDVAVSLGGDYSHLAAVEHDIKLATARETAASEARVLAGAMQLAVGNVQSGLGALATAAVTAGNPAGGAALEAASAEARGKLDAFVAALNGDIAGRSLFAGDDVATTPLPQPEDIMNAARGAVAGLTSVPAIQSALSDFFHAPGGGFETQVYQGASDPVSPIRLGHGESVTLDVRADDPAIRSALEASVTAALASDSSLTLTTAQRQTLMQGAGEALIGAEGAMTGLRADIGVTESRIEQSLSRIASEKSSLVLARNELLAVDPFQTATELESVRLQLETLYSVTARTSHLNLASFLT